MKRKATILICVFILLLTSVFPAFAREEYDISGIIDNIAAASPMPAQYDEGFDWIAFGLARAEKDLDGYLEKINVENKSSTDINRAALVTAALGGNAEALIDKGVFKQSDLGRQGLNGYIWALIALDSVEYEIPNHEELSREQLIEKILYGRNSDGGFSLNRSKSDVDITAMALTALAPYRNDKSVSDAIEGGIDWLSKSQQADGGFASWGTENAESTAQVIIALCTLGIDVRADKRFVKNQSNPIDGLMKYYTDGGFAHYVDENGEKRINRIATGQGLCALAALQRFDGNKPVLFNLTDVEKKDIPVSAPSTPDEENENVNPKVIIITLLTVLALIAIILSKKKSDVILIIIVFAVILVFVLVSNFQSTEDYYGENLENITEGSETVTLSIRCDKAISSDSFDASLIDNGYVPRDGIILAETEYVLREGDSVFDILSRAVKHNRIQMEYQGEAGNGFGTVYIEGISYLYEFDCGPSSGWLYTVNHENPNYGISQYFPADGDVIEIYYTLEYN